jgi:hypothetical protein
MRVKRFTISFLPARQEMNGILWGIQEKWGRCTFLGRENDFTEG